MDFVIDEMRPADWPWVSAIFSEDIETGTATFLRQAPPWEEWDREHCADCRLVARHGETVLGWAALSPFSSRCVYSGIAGVSLYIAKKSRGQGVGTSLIRGLVRRSEEAGYYSLQGEIIKENLLSRALFKKCGFREIGIRERYGQMSDGTWHDVVLAEKRSNSAGL